MTSLLLVEDHPIFADALLSVLHGRGYSDVTVVDAAEKALVMIPELNPDLVLVDYSLPKMNGIELIVMLHHRYPDILCLMISGHLSSRYVRHSLEAGARGYVIKDSLRGILEGIKHVLDGEIYVSKELRN